MGYKTISNFHIKSVHILVSILMTFITIFIIPDKTFEKYNLIPISKFKNDAIIYFHDFNHDGTSEKVSLSLLPTLQSIDIQPQKQFLQFIPAQIYYVSPNGEKIIPEKAFFDDYNHDGKDEIFFFSINDSLLFLNVYTVDIDSLDLFPVVRVALTKYYHFSGNPDIIIKTVDFSDLDNDGFDDIIFIATAGYNIQPRNIYCFNLKSNHLFSTPYTAIEYDSFVIYDVNKDGKKEIIVNDQATGNTLPIDEVEKLKNSKDPDTLRLYNFYKKLAYKYGDFSAYILTLDNELNFMYPPIEFRGWTKIVHSIPFKKNKILSTVTSRRDTNWIPLMLISDLHGNILKEIKLSEYKLKPFLFISYDSTTNLITLMGEENTNIWDIYDTNLTLVKKKVKPDFLKLSNNNLFDINNDGIYERIYYSSYNNSIIISDYNFEYLKIHKINQPNFSKAFFNKLIFKNKPYLHAYLGAFSYIFDYKKNIFYYLKYLVYILIFIIWFLILQLLIKINNRRLGKENERLEQLVKERTKDIREKNKELRKLNDKLSKLNEDLQKQKQQIITKNEELNQLLEEILTQRDQIQEQKEKIEKIHLEFSKSIDYATKLQNSILPNPQKLAEFFSDNFIFFYPKDRVSGDFYWWTKVGNEFIVVVADCTGHGVPGAFMSMLGISLLREIVEKEKILSPAKILISLRKEIIKTLKQKGERGDQKDGMDMAIIKINKETQTCTFAGANNYAYLITKSAPGFDNINKIKEFNWSNTVSPELRLYELVPDKMPVSFYSKMDDFTELNFKYHPEDRIYMFTDGFADQFGGPQNKKFKQKTLKKLLIQISHLPAKEQYEILKKTFEAWKGINEQVDDVTILGLFF